MMSAPSRHMASTSAVLTLLLFLGVVVQPLDAMQLKVNEFSMLMPNVTVKYPETYLCAPVKVDAHKSYYIVGFEPMAEMRTAHHVIIYGCGRPGTQRPVWNCGEMAQTHAGEEKAEPPCARGHHTQTVFAWARDAKRLELPPGVGFKVGRDSPIDYLVLQVHYAHKLKEGVRDASGINVIYTEQTMPKQAGVLLLGTNGVIAPHTVEHMEVDCPISEDKAIHPFAYRTHTHSLGKVVSGYRVRRDEDGVDEWTLLGKRDPMTPQMFYPVMDNGTLHEGDRLAARCTMESHRNRITNIGATNEDEMCNFYLMYHMDEGVEPLDTKYCFSMGPPLYYWSNSDSGLNNIPELDASTL